jgi:nitronate monooxygenase
VPELKEPFPPFDQERLDLVLELRPRIASFHFGLPEASALRRIKEAGCVILSSATTVAEARSLEANGADVIIAQGFEAGGHRGASAAVQAPEWSVRWRWCRKSSMPYAYR